MTLTEVITDIHNQSEEGLIFAKRIDGKFLRVSEVCVVETEDEELDNLEELAGKYCPGFEYFLEVFLVRDLIEEMKDTVGYKSLEQQVDRIIYYAENDA